MRFLPWLELMSCWFAWLYPFLFRAPHYQKRESITVSGLTYAGIFLEGLGIFLAFAIRMPADAEIGELRIIGAAIFGVTAAVLAWTSVYHLGKQFRIRAGLYEDHELVRSGPYAVVRHPIYASLLAILICTLMLMTPWEWMALPIVLFLVGTEIRVRTEDKLLESRFEDQFREYQRRVRAYVPFVR